MECSRVQLVLQERTVATGRENALTHMSDHFGVHAVLDVRAHAPPLGFMQEAREAEWLFTSSRFRIEEAHEELLGQVLVALQQHSKRMRSWSWRMTMLVTPLLAFAVIALWILPSLWVDGWWWSVPRWMVLIHSVVLSMLSSAWAICLGYGFLHGNESIAAYVNAIQEVELALARARCSKPWETVSVSTEQSHSDLV